MASSRDISPTPPPIVVKGPRLMLPELLRLLPESELSAVASRLRIKLDPRKRIDPSMQLAKALIALRDLRDPMRFAPEARALLLRIAEQGGALTVDALPAAVQPLMASATIFVRALEDDRLELVLPIAFLLQMRTWEGEDPRGLRALIQQTSSVAAASIATHYLGRSASPPQELALEEAWSTLTDPARLKAELLELAPLERRLLSSVEELGGEVDTEELLNLEREPLRLRGAAGATPSRRGIGFALERRGFLIPIHPNRHVIPSEVGVLVGARQREERATRRAEIRKFVLDEFHSPRRAIFAEDPSALALALAMAVRESPTELNPEVGVPKSLLVRFATRFGRDVEVVTFVAALSRAVGLWEPGANGTLSPPGKLSLSELRAGLFEAWQRGGGWDESLPEGDPLRVSRTIREASVVGVIRSLLLDGLRELGDERWVPWEALAGFVRTDSRTPGLNRLIERWAARGGFEATSPAEIARRMTFDSLHTLGIVDLGASEDELESGESFSGPTVRVTARGKALLEGRSEPECGPSAFTTNQLLRIGTSAKVGDVLSLTGLVEVGRVVGDLEVLVTSAAISSALSAGIPADELQRSLEALCALPDPLQRQLDQAATVLGRGEYIPCEGFLWVEDPELRELLSTRRGSADLFVQPSPPAGLLIAPGVSLDRVTRRCRALGIEIVVEGNVHRAGNAPASRSGPSSRRAPNSAPPSQRRVRKGVRERKIA